MAIWAAGFLITKDVLGVLAPFTVLAIRFFVAALVLLVPVMQWHGLRLERCDVLPVVACSLLNPIAYNILGMYGLRLTSASHAAVLGVFGTTPKTGMVIPNKVYQSMACGRPVVTADTPAVREIFTPGEHLVCVPPGDPGALAEALARLSAGRDAAAELGTRGGELVRAEYNPEKVAGRLLGLLGWGAAG